MASANRTINTPLDDDGQRVGIDLVKESSVLAIVFAEGKLLGKAKPDSSDPIGSATS